jgi:hypothetical protein
MHPYAVRLFSKGKDAFYGAEKISNYPWGGDYRPEAEFSLSYGENALYLALRAWEKTEFLRMTAQGLCRDVWHDSCLECFLMPKPEIDARYLNFEFNPAGAMYLGLGTTRQDNEFLEREDISQFDISPFREDVGSGVTLWGVKAQIPLVFLRRFFPLFKLEPGIKMRANFYKCGEETPEPHYACWSKVNTREPDFHRPEYFGLLTTL